MRIYLIAASDYLELGETPAFDYEGNLFKFTDFTLSRSVDMTIPRSVKNDMMLAHPSSVSQESTVIDHEHEAVLCGRGVQVKGTLYVSEVTPDGYEATFTYGDLDGLEALDEKIGDVYDSGSAVCLTLERGETSLSAISPTELNPMVCMDYSVNLEASQDEYGTGFSSADMNCILYSSTRGAFIALGDKEGWTSENGVTWERLDSSIISRYTWYSLEEDSDGNLVAAGETTAGYMMVASAPSSGYVFTLSYSSGGVGNSVKKRMATYQNGSYVAVTNGKQVVIINSGAYYKSLAYPSSGWRIDWIGGSGNTLMALTADFVIDAVTYCGFTANLSTGAVTYRTQQYIGASAAFLSSLSSSLRSSNPNHSFYYHDDNTVDAEDTECVYVTGIEWTKILDEPMYAMTYGEGYYVGVGKEGSTWYGTSYTSLTEGGSCGEQSLHSVTYNSSTWVAVGDVGAFFYSTDHGASWNAGNSVISINTTGFAPMPCVNLMWLAYQGIRACGLIPIFSDSAKSLAPYLYIMLSQCVDQYGLEVSEGATCYLRHNMPDMTVLELLELTCSLVGELPYIDGSYLRFFNYDFSSSVMGTYDVCEWESVLHAVTDDGAQSNDIVLSLPNSDEDSMGDDTDKIWSFPTPNATLDDSTELYSSDVSTGASDGGILQVTNVEIEADEDDDGNVTYEVTREGDLTLCWYDGGNARMMYVGNQTLTTRMKWAGLSTPAGVQNLMSVYANALTYTATLEMSLPRFMEIAFDDLIALEGAAFCVESASWSDGVCEATLVRIPRENLLPNKSSNTYTISVAVSPSGSGIVSGGGTYAYGTEVTLSASPSIGYYFYSWSDGMMSATRTITVIGKALYTAYFKAEITLTYTVIVSASPSEGGLVSGGGTYDEGTEVTLSASPSIGYTFSRWNTGETSDTLLFTITNNVEYTAYFTINTYTITTAASPEGGGSVSGGGTYEYGTLVTLAASASAGYTFSKWSTGETTAILSVTATEDMEYIAYFTTNTYAVVTSVSPSGGGLVSGGGTYEYGTIVTLTATPSAGYTFTQWSTGETTETLSFTITSNMSYTAYFTINAYTIVTSVSPSGGGLVSGGGTYEYGTLVTLSASPSVGYTFSRWSTGETTDTISVTITSDMSYVAYFTANTYTITTAASPEEGGTVTGGGTYEYGTNATLEAIPNEDAGYSFSQWSDGAYANPRTVEVTGDASYTALFNSSSYKLYLYAHSTTGGSINATLTGAGTYSLGEYVVVTAVKSYTESAGTRYTFQYWSDNYDGTNRLSTSTTYTVEITGNITLYAYYSPGEDED